MTLRYMIIYGLTLGGKSKDSEFDAYFCLTLRHVDLHVVSCQIRVYIHAGWLQNAARINDASFEHDNPITRGFIHRNLF